MRSFSKYLVFLIVLFCPILFSACGSVQDNSSKNHVHNWNSGKVIVESKCVSSGLILFTCVNCLETKIEEALPIGHLWENDFESDIESHWNTCEREGCDEKNIQSHEWGDGVLSIEPTCTENGEKIFTCKVCCMTNNQEISNLGHCLSEEYQSDEKYHWQCCTNNDCGHIKKGSHVWDLGEINKPPMCEENGVKIYHCKDCNKIKSEEVQATGHSWGNDYYSDNREHWFRCLNEGCILLQANKHTYNYNGNGACTDCGFSALQYMLQKDDTYAVSLKDDVQVEFIKVPKEYNGKEVTSIPEGAFNCSTLLKVELTDQITNIAFNAFSKWKQIDEIVLPFLGGSLEDEVNAHIAYVFGEENKSYACNELKKITILSGEIQQDAFKGCAKLEEVILGDKVTCIGNEAFRNCSNLTRVEFSDNITQMGTEAFAFCSKLSNVELPSKLTQISDGLFENCSSLKKIVITDNILTIGDYAFSWCESLITIKIGKSLNAIGQHGFYGCDSLVDVYIPNLSMWCNMDIGTILGNPLYYAKNLYIDNILTTELVVKDIATIKQNVFAYFEGITSVYIGKEVTSICQEAFSHCGFVKKIEFEETEGWRLYGASEKLDFSNAESNAKNIAYMYRNFLFIKSTSE